MPSKSRGAAASACCLREIRKSLKTTVTISNTAAGKHISLHNNLTFHANQQTIRDFAPNPYV